MAEEEVVNEVPEEVPDEEPREGGGPTSDAPAPCPPCKGGGAPAWMATFADMATLLMAFFVLLLSFAEMNVPKYKQIAGSMKAAFGVKRVVPVISIPTARSLVKEEFTPAVAQPTVIDRKRQRSEEMTKKNVVVKTQENKADFKTEQSFRKLEETLAEEIEQGQVVVRLEGERVVVELQSPQSSGGEDSSSDGNGSGGPISQETLDIAAKVIDAQAETSTEIEVRKQQLASGSDISATDTQDSDQNPSGGGASNNQNIEDRLQKIRSDLAAEIQMGLAEVERDGDRIIVRLASQGSFVSGSANLQAGFITLLRQVGDSLAASEGKVRVEGHTDNVPVAFSERFNSNWDLSAARSATVADFFINNSGFAQENMLVAGFADTKPIATNNTSEGRARNRRIEVIVDGS
ncbi:MAG: flagellar motor protein MotB [Porticoccaceae bacterium]|nr:flagellar motor protein MotB [Porticoccaceae bacterium]